MDDPMFVSQHFPDNLDDTEFARAMARRRRARDCVVDLADGSPSRAWSTIDALSGVKDSYEDIVASAARDAISDGYDPAPAGRYETREAIARSYKDRGLDIAPSRIIVCASTSEAYTWLAKLLAADGESVRVPKPSYPLFEHLLGLEGLTVQPDALDFRGRWVRSGFESTEREASFAVAVHPNNPTGHALDDGTLRDLHSSYSAVAVDEVFLDFGVDRQPLESSLSMVRRRDDPGLHVVLSGLSKTCGLPGMKLGWIVVDGPDGPAQAAIERLTYIADAFLSANDVTQRAAPALLARRSEFQEPVRARLRASRRRIRSVIDDTEGWSSYPVEGGWYQILRHPNVVDEETLAVELLSEEGIEIMPGFLFDLPPGHLVLSLLSPPEVLQKHLPRLVAGFDALTG
jgi:aspartate/methionine/tyrosine aminotransferase